MHFIYKEIKTNYIKARLIYGTETIFKEYGKIRNIATQKRKSIETVLLEKITTEHNTLSKEELYLLGGILYIHTLYGEKEEL